MERTAEEQRIAAIMADRTGTNGCDWYLVYRARQGMLVALEEVRKVYGAGSVATQLLTCCTAIDPIIAAGLTPWYGEVSEQTAALDPEALEMPDDACVVMLQHTFGIVDDASSRSLARRAHEAGALVFEDCAHCATRMARDEHGKPLADISFHSFGTGKMLNSRVGAAVWLNPESAFSEVIAGARARFSSLALAGSWLNVLDNVFILQNRVFNHIPSSLAHALRHGLARVQLFEPVVSAEELRGGIARTPMRLSAPLCRKVLQAFDVLDSTMRQRQAATEIMRAGLTDCPGVTVMGAAATGPVQPLLRLPISVRDSVVSDRVISAVRAAGYYTEPWYRPGLYPGVPDERLYQVPADHAGLARTDSIIDRITALPTDRTPDEAEDIVRIVREVCA